MLIYYYRIYRFMRRKTFPETSARKFRLFLIVVSGEMLTVANCHHPSSNLDRNCS